MKVADLFALLSVKVDKDAEAKSKKLLSGLKTGLTAVVAGASAATFAMVKLVGSTANAADEYAKMSKKVGVSVEALQQLEFAAGISGSNLQTVAKAMKRLAGNAQDADDGLSTAKRAFDRIGVSTKNSKGELKDLDSLLMDVAESFSQMEDGTKKAALADDLFGKAGAELIPLLNEGKDGIKALREEFTSLGGEISTKQAKSFEGYNDTLLRIKTVLGGLARQIAIELLPVFKEVSTKVFEWFKENRKLIKQKIVFFLENLIKVLAVVFKIIGLVIDNIDSLTVSFVLYKAALVAAGLAAKIMAAESLAAAVKTGIAWLAASAGLVLMIALLVAVFLIVEDFVSFLMGKDSLLGEMFGDSIKEWMSDLRLFFKWLNFELNRAVNKGVDILETLFGEADKGDSSTAQDANVLSEVNKRKTKRLAAEGLGTQIRAAAAAQFDNVKLSPSDFEAMRALREAGAFSPGTPQIQQYIESNPGRGVLLDPGASAISDLNQGRIINNTFNFSGMGLQEVEQKVSEVVDSKNEELAESLLVPTP